jgi:hypothetical protein
MMAPFRFDLGSAVTFRIISRISTKFAKAGVQLLLRQ